MTRHRISEPARLALLIHTLAGGGIERVFLTLAGAFAARGHRVDLLVCRPGGRMAGEVPGQVRLVGLRASTRLHAHAAMVAADPGGLALMAPLLVSVKPPWAVRYLPALCRYLREERPDALLSADTSVNLIALWAQRLTAIEARFLVSEQANFSFHIAAAQHRVRRAYPALVARTYPQANGIVAVSDGVADDLARTTGLARERITTIHNPISDPTIARLAREPLTHPWFAAGAPPVVLSVGRLSRQQKDYATLIEAFARLRSRRPTRLVVLGEGRDRRPIEQRARRLGVAADVDLPGWVDNPFAYMARAAVLVLSSPAEGFGNVLVEAMACGCPVASTDSPYGPAEILDDGRFGPLVPVGDAEALAEAIRDVLDAPLRPRRLRERAACFSVEHAVTRYLDVLLGGGPDGEWMPCRRVTPGRSTS